MTKLVKLSLAAAVMVTGLSASDYSVSGDATFATNSLWRGATGTGNTPTVQSTLNVEHKSGAYAGMWGTGTATGSEIDLYVGYATEVSGFGIDAGFVDYTTTSAETEDWTVDGSGELYVGVSKTVASIDLGATVYEEVLADDTATTLEGSIGKDLDVVSLSALAGYNVDTEAKYVSATASKSIESIKGDIALTVGQATDGDAVYALTYTTSF